MQLLINKSAAERILGLDPFSISLLKILHTDQIQIITTAKQEYQIPKSRFYQHFSIIRRQNSEKLQISSTNYNNLFFVTNPENNNKYPVRVTADTVQCKCRDYQKQIELMGKGCCKHGYRVLNHLGYSTLEKYLNREQAIAR